MVRSAQVASNVGIPTGLVYKSRGVCICRCCVVCMFASMLCMYYLRKCDLFILSWVRVQGVCLGSVSSLVFIDGGGVRLVFMSCSVMVSGLVLMFIMYLVLLNVACFLSHPDKLVWG